jgi:hypothetical protein
VLTRTTRGQLTKSKQPRASKGGYRSKTLPYRSILEGLSAPEGVSKSQGFSERELDGSAFDGPIIGARRISSGLAD